MKTLVLCGVMLAIAAPAAAGGIHLLKDRPEVPPQATIGYADLDLSRPAGADVLVTRIRHAALRVCGQELFAELDRSRHVRGCIRQASEAAITQIDAPLVTARYREVTLAAR